jgi:hypothetical protein
MLSGFMIRRRYGQPMIAKSTTEPNGWSSLNYICATRKKLGACSSNASAPWRLSVSHWKPCSLIAALVAAENIEGGTETIHDRKRLEVEGMIGAALQSVRESQDRLAKDYAHFVDGVITESEYLMFKDGFKRKIEAGERSIGHSSSKTGTVPDPLKFIEERDGLIETVNKKVVLRHVNRNLHPVSILLKHDKV